jgi:2-methylcitrate dehydratase PrpD
MDQFEPERYDDPALRRYATECVDLVGHPELAAEQAIVEAEMNDGSVLSARCNASKGTPENPLTRAEIEEKFRKGAKDRIAPAAAERVIETVSRLEDLESARTLMDALRTE